MKLYHSNMGSVKFEKDEIPKIGVLVSYYGLGKIPVFDYCDKLFLDSGAFSAWNQKISIDLYAYMDFLHLNKHEFDICAALDVIGDHEKSMDYYKIMLDNNLDTLPAFHFGEPFDVLKEYTEYTNYIGLGGVAASNKKAKVRWLDSIFSLYPDNEKIGFHGYGIMDEDIIKRYPWKSIDATSAHILARFGGIFTPWGRFKVNPNVHYSNLKWRSPIAEERLKRWVRDAFNIDYESLKLQNSIGTKMRCIVNILYYEQYVRENSKRFFDKKVVQKGFGF